MEGCHTNVPETRESASVMEKRGHERYVPVTDQLRCSRRRTYVSNMVRCGIRESFAVCRIVRVKLGREGGVFGMGPR